MRAAAHVLKRLRGPGDLVPLGNVPLRVVHRPLRDFPRPLGDFSLGVILRPLGDVPWALGDVPLGDVPLGDIPLGDVPI